MFGFFRQKVNVIGITIIFIAEFMYATLAVKLTNWNKDFFDVLQAKSVSTITPFIWHFVYLCLLSFAAFEISGYFSRVLAVLWRKKIITDFTQRWIYSHHFLVPKFLNTEQYITEDSVHLTEVFFHLLQHFVRSALLLMFFLPVLWNISNALNVIPGFLVWIALVVAIIGSFGFQKLFGHRLLQLQNSKEDTNAVLRSHLMYISLNAENVLMQKGEEFERQQLQAKLQDNIYYSHIYIIWQTILKYFQGLYAKINAVLAMFVVAPFYLAGRVSFGVMSQTTTVFFYIADACSFWAHHTADISFMSTAYRRLAKLEQTMKIRRKALQKIKTEQVESIYIKDLTLTAGNQTLLTNLNMEFKPGKRVMLKGKSGIGKSTLFRALAGLHYEYSGEVIYPEDLKQDEVFFSSQSVYLPLIADKINMITYPKIVAEEEVYAILHKVGLNIDIHDDLTKLSVGQKQRLLFAKVLLYRPKFLFLDEPTSSLPKAASLHLMELLHEELKDASIVIISHQDFLEELYDQVIVL